MSIVTNLISKIHCGNSTRPSLDTMLAMFDKELENFQSLVLPTSESKPRTPFDSPDLPIEKMSMANMSTRQLMRVLPIMLPLVAKMRASSKLYDGKFQPKRSEATPEFIDMLEKIAQDTGAKDIKYIKVPRNAIFQHKGIPHEFAIVFTVEMDQENISTAPSYAAFREVAKGYKNLAVIANKLARLMRKHGYAAYPGTALGGITDYTHLGELASLGAIGYHGMLITPGEGTRLRINTIYTNITNLPIEAGNEHLWVRDFCAMCKKCIRECPVYAIFQQPKPRGDGGIQCINHDSCRDYFNQNFGCAICLAVCPFSVAGYDKVKSRFTGNPTAPQFRIHVATNLEVDQQNLV
jgi:epoxyqueuosine reductase